MKTLSAVLPAAFMLLAAGAAQSEDWSGAYMGFNAGYGTSEIDWRLVENAGNEVSSNVGNSVTSNSPDGMLGGIQFGHNWQQGDFVGGVEMEISASNADAYSTWTNEDGRFRDAAASIEYTASLAARAGFDVQDNLLYLKLGGVAVNGDYHHTGGSLTSPRELDGSDSQFGVLVGAGIERKINERASLRFHVPRSDVSLTDGNRTAIFGLKQDMHTFKVGLNFSFGN